MTELIDALSELRLEAFITRETALRYGYMVIAELANREYQDAGQMLLGLLEGRKQ